VEAFSMSLLGTLESRVLPAVRRFRKPEAANPEK